MQTERVEVRLDAERRRRLQRLADDAAVSVSEAVRALIDRAYAEHDRAERLAAAQRIVARQVEEVPEPEQLAAELASTSALCHLDDEPT